ncbi:spermidine/putrescine transport system ATP-binding protein [Ketogulonicigenium robustum]|uniref:Spermidine/putrescine transport system ATP-binding protein n=1 Tax=Ketogulonicigenium robustum TaxID=92947 RepID=A0A1W6P182_9RHOB|nr:ABC transporter ATP-binding protein [Ketogulonicigenium robustum]ARO15265.1 spermidine/putrescine transport system ATP-binding protein [Ketogulonicigenium robustum]
MSSLTLRALEKSFGGTPVVKSVSLDVADGELVCLLGPSGSGKSTILRMIGGFEAADSGQVLIDGADMTRVPPEKRPTGMVFQSHALWSHMDVAANVAFGLRLRGLAKAAIAQKVDEVLTLVGLEGYGKRRVWQLSGGQQQRVALARSLALEPKILLLDEPFASLDQHLREHLREELRDIQQRLGITTVFVTHGQDEALALADRIVVLKDGMIEQADTPARIYRQPATRFVAGFIGTMNFVKTDFRAQHSTHPLFRTRANVGDGPATLAIRPEAMQLERGEGGRIHRVTDFGTHMLAEVGIDGCDARLKVICPPGAPWMMGDSVRPSATDVAVFHD